MNKFLISKIWSQNLLNLQRFCSRIFGVVLTPTNNVDKKLDENDININVDNNFTENKTEESLNKTNLLKMAKQNATNFPVLPPITIDDIEDEFDDFEDFFDSSPENIVQPFDKKIIQSMNDVLIKPIDSNVLKLNLLSTIADEYNLKPNNVNNNLVSEDIFENTNDTNYEIVETVNKKAIDSINYDLLKLHLSSQIVDDLAEEIDDIDMSNEYLNGIYNESTIYDDVDEFTQDYENIPENINTTKIDDIVRPIRNIFLKNHHQSVTVHDIADEYEDDEDFLENSEENKIEPLIENDIESQMAKLIVPELNEPIEQPKEDYVIPPTEQQDTIQTQAYDNTKPKEEEILPIKKEGILKYHLPPVNVGGEDDDELLDDESDDDEILKRVGEYKSNGIKVFIPQNKMPPGTIRYQLNKIPDGLPDDIRVIHYD